MRDDIVSPHPFVGDLVSTSEQSALKVKMTASAISRVGTSVEDGSGESNREDRDWSERQGKQEPPGAPTTSSSGSRSGCDQAEPTKRHVLGLRR
jgi:hypothetical protein